MWPDLSGNQERTNPSPIICATRKHLLLPMAMARKMKS